MSDDYGALLDFSNNLVAREGWASKSSYFATAQHNEYKLFFERAVAWCELALTGRLSFLFLCALGNAFVLLIAAVLWKMFLPQCDLKRRLWLFVPVSCLLFNLHYAGTLNWSMAALANLPVIAFSLAAIYLLTRGAVGFALPCMMLAIASLANGFCRLGSSC